MKIEDLKKGNEFLEQIKNLYEYKKSFMDLLKSCDENANLIKLTRVYLSNGTYYDINLINSIDFFKKAILDYDELIQFTKKQFDNL